jgi:hypothetical protein
MRQKKMKNLNPSYIKLETPKTKQQRKVERDGKRPYKSCKNENSSNVNT